MKLDRRFTIAKEFCGYSTPRYVARFCGEWLGQAETRAEARLIAINHKERVNTTEMACSKDCQDKPSKHQAYCYG